MILDVLVLLMFMILIMIVQYVQVSIVHVDNNVKNDIYNIIQEYNTRDLRYVCY